MKILFATSYKVMIILIAGSFWLLLKENAPAWSLVGLHCIHLPHDESAVKMAKQKKQCLPASSDHFTSYLSLEIQSSPALEIGSTQGSMNMPWVQKYHASKQANIWSAHPGFQMQTENGDTRGF